VHTLLLLALVATEIASPVVVQVLVDAHTRRREPGFDWEDG
jgi:hypothetical protein